MIEAFISGISDIRSALGMRAVWLALAAEDVTDQHRRTALGPIWLLINYLAFVGTFAIVIGQVSAIPQFPVYVAIGLLVWLYISEVITLSVSLFTRAESFIKGTPMPLSLYVMQLTTQSVIRAGYALVGCIAILLLANVPIGVPWLWSGLAILLILIATPAAVMVFAIIGAYFPDLQFIVSNLMRVGMFLTPIFWTHGGQGGLRAAIYFWNPFTYFLEIVRVPIYSGAFPTEAYLTCATITVGLWIAALLLLGKNRKNISLVL